MIINRTELDVYSPLLFAFTEHPVCVLYTTTARLAVVMLTQKPNCVIQQTTEPYIRVCMKVWLLCESAIHNELKAKTPRYSLVQFCSDCARSCFSLVSQLVGNNQADHMGPMAFDCWLLCRQCSDACAAHMDEEDYLLCTEACMGCGEELKKMFHFTFN